MFPFRTHPRTAAVLPRGAPAEGAALLARFDRRPRWSYGPGVMVVILGAEAVAGFSGAVLAVAAGGVVAALLLLAGIRTRAGAATAAPTEVSV